MGRGFYALSINITVNVRINGRRSDQ